MELLGLHHITAVTGNAAGNVAFYTQVLGMRLVKKTVNQDDVSAYHLFYGDELGHPGTELTFFDWPTIGPNSVGTGSIGAIALRVPGDALEWWAGRLQEHGLHPRPVQRNGKAALAFADPEGQRLFLVAESGDGVPAGTPWRKSHVPVERAVLGLHSVTLVVDNLIPTRWVLSDALGMREAWTYPFLDDVSRQATVFAMHGGGAGAEVHVEERPELQPGRVGTGGVHHVAFRTPGEEEQRAWRQRLMSARLGVTPVIDRFYFRSIYFREPGGVLCEIATDGPGFTSDEDAGSLGERLSLPPFLERHRAQIEAGLRPL